MAKIDCSVTVNFIRESDRMCESFGSTCDGCPLLRKDMVCDTYMSKYPDRAVEIVQKWSDEHPVKTRLEDLLKKFPDFKLLSEIGRPTFKPRIFGYCDCCALCPNNKAEHCWNEPVDGGATGKAVE